MSPTVFPADDELPWEAMANRLARLGRRLRERAGRLAWAGARATVGRSLHRLRGGGEPIWERDWDVCCVLDGCRYDLMCEAAASDRHPFLAPGAVDDLWSVGSQSAEWMDRTFAPAHREAMAETAYVTGNPFTAQTPDVVGLSGDVLPLDGDRFGRLYEAWREEWRDGEISTIPPRPLTDAAIAIWRRREELGVERVLVHYMQPHAPFRSRPEWFLGSADTTDWGQLEDDGGDGRENGSGRENGEGRGVVDGPGDGASRNDGASREDGADGRGADGDGDGELAELAALDPEEVEALELLAEADDDAVRDPWTRLRDGELAPGEFWRAYRENLDWVLAEVDALLSNCDGRVALTSDHGNGAGEWGVWSHPPHSPVPALRRVPWVALSGSDERTRDPDLPAAAREAVDAAPAATVERRLADLGYR